MTLKRLVPWITLVISAVILFMLFRALRQYDVAEVLRALTEVSPIRVALAIACTAGSYFCLTLFDTMAIRYLRRDLPYRRIARASFTALSIGHNAGLAALSSGAIRYRFYARSGLSAQEIGKLILFCASTVALGLATLGGLAWTLQPRLAAELTGLGLPAVYAVGLGCLGLAAAWLVLAAVARGPVRLWKWRIEAPPLRLAAAQILVGTVNFGLVAGALHQSLLTAADVGYVKVAAVYVIASMLAIASHVPGGLGVIEAVVIYLLPEANLLSAVILFRAVYYLLPLPLGLALFLWSELRHRRHAGSRAAPARRQADGARRHTR